MRAPKIYRRVTLGRVIRTAVKTLLIVLLVLVILFVFLFFYLRKYAVYSDDGVHIVFDRQTEQSAPPEN